MSVESGGAADDIVQAADQPQTPAAPALKTPGELLRVERERRGLKVQQAADELHLDARLISAIESNNFLALGAPVYAKGHLRKYASLLGLSPEVVIAHYQTLTDVPAVPVVVPLTSTPPPRQRISLRVPAWIVAVLVIGAVVWWLASWLLDQRGSGEPTAADSANVAVPVAVEPTPEPSTSQQAPREPAESLVVRPASATSVTTPSSATAPGAVTLRLQFASASWAEVYDATDKRLMFDIGQPGQTRNLYGTPPLRVNLGLAAAVSMEINNRTVAIPRRPGKDAARFVVAADGSVR